MLHISINVCRYEAVFYSALALALMAWILFENALLHYSKTDASQSSIGGVEDNFQLENGNRSLQLSDMRIPLVFVSHTFLCVLMQVIPSLLYVLI